MSRRATATTILRRAAGGYRALALIWLNVCVLLLVINGVAAWMLSGRAPRARPMPDHVRRALEVAFPDLSDAERARLHRESRQAFVRDPLALFRERPHDGRYFTVDPAGFRHGAEQGPWPPSDDHWNVFLFGGSTAFGYGVPDEHTVASYLQKELVALGVSPPPRLYNFARGAFHSTEERLLFSRLATLGDRPQLAVFIDGLNDFYVPQGPPPLVAHLTRQTARDLEAPLRMAARSLPAVRLLGLVRDDPFALEAPGGRPEERADAAIGRYVANQRIARELAAAHGIQVAFVWQPVPMYEYDLRHHTFRGSFGGHEISRTGYPRMRAYVEENPLGRDFIWCADIQRDLDELLYVDQVHYSPRGNALLAACIASALDARGLLPAR